MSLIKNLKSSWPILSVLFFSFIVRFIFLDIIPNSIGGDELNYVLTAKSAALTGKDLTQTWNLLFLFFFNYPPGQNQAELLYFLQIPFVGFVNSSLFSTRIVNLFFGIGLVFMIYLIAKEIFDKKTALIAGLVASFNPWLIYIGRTAYEGTAAIFFYCLAFYILLIAKNKKILFSIPVLFIAFYSYIGTKIIFLPVVVVTLIYLYFFVNKKKFGKYYLIVFGFCFALVSFFAFTVLTSSNSRVSELISLNAPQIASEVNYQRQNSITMPFTEIFENKYTQMLRIMITKLFKVFSFDYLFISGDYFFSITRNGLFYVLDLFFIILGFLFLFSKKRKLFIFLSILILITVIPQILHSANIDNFTYHLNLMFPFMILIIAYGISTFFEGLKGKLLYFAGFITAVIYLFLISYFLNTYFFQHPLMGNFDFRLRILSKYISIYHNEKINVHSTNGKDYFTKYLFYSDKLIKKNKDEISKNILSNKPGLSNVSFKNCNSDLDPSKYKEQIFIFDANCSNIGHIESTVNITQLFDGGVNFVIFNDQICQKYYLKRYPRITSIEQFNIEKMDSKTFCETYITK